MAGLTRVPAPKSPFDGRSAAFGGLLVVVIVALAIEPWGSTRTPAVPTPSPYRARTSAIPALPAGRTAALRSYCSGVLSDASFALRLGGISSVHATRT